jgi:hypothetical protein
VSSKSVPNTGSWGAYQTIEMDLGDLTVGSHVVDIDINSHSFNLNWMSFEFVEDEGPVDPDTCHAYSYKDRAELDLSVTNCVDLPVDLAGKTLTVWDSDANPSCDFRGSVEIIDGSGSINISGNYKSSNTLTGNKLRFVASNGCDFVKMRVY